MDPEVMTPELRKRIEEYVRNYNTHNQIPMYQRHNPETFRKAITEELADKYFGQHINLPIGSTFEGLVDKGFQEYYSPYGGGGSEEARKKHILRTIMSRMQGIRNKYSEADKYGQYLPQNYRSGYNEMDAEMSRLKRALMESGKDKYGLSEQEASQMMDEAGRRIGRVGGSENINPMFNDSLFKSSLNLPSSGGYMGVDMLTHGIRGGLDPTYAESAGRFSPNYDPRLGASPGPVLSDADMAELNKGNPGYY